MGSFAQRICRYDKVAAVGGHQRAIIADAKFDFGQAHRTLLCPSDKTMFHENLDPGSLGIGKAFGQLPASPSDASSIDADFSKQLISLAMFDEPIGDSKDP